MTDFGDFVFYSKKDVVAHGKAFASLPKKGYSLVRQSEEPAGEAITYSALWKKSGASGKPFVSFRKADGGCTFQSAAFLELDIEDTVAQALERYLDSPFLQHVVVRRRDADIGYWYVFESDFFFKNFLSAAGLTNPKATLREVGKGFHEDRSTVAYEQSGVKVNIVPRGSEAWPAGLSPVGLKAGKLDCIWTKVDLDTASLIGGGQDLVVAGDPFLVPPPPSPDGWTELFPSIELSERSPVQDAPLVVTVSLSAVRDPFTSGSAGVPPGPKDEVLDVRVHLLYGETSGWSALRVTRGGDCSVKAVFNVRAPLIPPDKDGVRPPTRIDSIRVNFYLNDRWCGEGWRPVGARRDSGVPPLEVEPTGGGGALFRSLVCLDPGAEPPDLVVRLQKREQQGKDGFFWSLRSPHANFDHYGEMDSVTWLDESAQNYVKSRYEPKASIALGRGDCALIEGIGEEIYKLTPRVFKDGYRLLRGLGKLETIQFITDEPYVPWELMRLPKEATDAGEPAELLAVRHVTGRWLANESHRLVQRIPVQDLAVFATDYAGTPSVPQLKSAKEEGKFLEDTYGARPLPLKESDVLDFLETGKAHLVHFACHGKQWVNDANLSQLILEDDPKHILPNHVNRSEVRDGMGSHHPLIFMNACQLGGTGAFLGLLAGWPAAFLGAGASAYIGPLWRVDDVKAGNVSHAFYTAALAPGSPSLGEILRDIRRTWKSAQHLTFLAYVLYGDPKARIDYVRAS